MGLFSSLCLGCDHPLLSPRATTRINAWMSDVVAVRDGQVIATGTYDGYGSIGSTEDAIDEASCWHLSCWTLAGRPTASTEVSPHADDQGWFFDDGSHDMLDPLIARCPLNVAMVSCANDRIADFEAYAVFDNTGLVLSVHLARSEAEHAASVADRSPGSSR